MIHVACVADEPYLPHCATMLASLLQLHPRSSVHFLRGSSLTVDTVAPLAEMIKQAGGHWDTHEVPDAWISGLPRLRNIPPLMWYRAYLPELLPDLDRILYLDADTLVIDDLTELWELPMEGYSIAAVDNVLEAAFEQWPQELGIAREQGYFNSGVLLMNLAEMRREGAAQALVDFGRNSKLRLKWPDQDALNVVLGSRRFTLNPRWNCQNSLFYYRWADDIFGPDVVREAVSRPAILHFEGGDLAKPWHFLSKHPYRNRYLDARSRTPWPKFQPEGRNLVARLLRPLPTPWTIALLKAAYRLKASVRQWVQHA